MLLENKWKGNTGYASGCQEDKKEGLLIQLLRFVFHMFTRHLERVIRGSWEIAGLLFSVQTLQNAATTLILIILLPQQVTKSNQFEFVRLVAETKFTTRNTKRFVA